MKGSPRSSRNAGSPARWRRSWTISGESPLLPDHIGAVRIVGPAGPAPAERQDFTWAEDCAVARSRSRTSEAGLLASVSKFMQYERYGAREASRKAAERNVR